MADPVVNRIRLIPRPKDFLDRNIGASGELYYSKTSSTIRAYDGDTRGGTEIVSEANLARTTSNVGIATVKQTVTVVPATGSDSGNKYQIDGVYRPTLELIKGYTYIFDQSDQTNLYYPNAEGTTLNVHPLFFSETEDGIHDSAGTYYETGVEYILDNEKVTRANYLKNFSTSTVRKTIITITADTPTNLYYFCQYHSGMGKGIETTSPGGGSASVSVGTNAPDGPSSGSIWFNSTNGRLYVYLQDADNDFWIQPSYPIPSSILDLGITDGDAGQVLKTDGNGNFSFGQGGGSLGDITATGTTLTTSDSSGISFTPSVTMSSDLTVENTLYAESIETTSTGAPTLVSDSTINLSAQDRVVINKSPIHLASYTTAQRDAITAINGDVVYNEETNKFQGYAGGSWVDLH